MLYYIINSMNQTLIKWPHADSWRAAQERVGLINFCKTFFWRFYGYFYGLIRNKKYFDAT